MIEARLRAHSDDPTTSSSSVVNDPVAALIRRALQRAQSAWEGGTTPPFPASAVVCRRYFRSSIQDFDRQMLVIHDRRIDESCESFLLVVSTGDGTDPGAPPNGCRYRRAFSPLDLKIADALARCIGVRFKCQDERSCCSFTNSGAVHTPRLVGPKK